MMKPQDDTKCHTEQSEVSKTQILPLRFAQGQNDISCENLCQSVVKLCFFLRVLRGLNFLCLKKS